MNVLQIVPELNAGGVERTTLEVAQALVDAGHIPHVASAGGRLENTLIDMGGILHRLDIGRKNPLTWPKHKRRLIHIIRAAKIDIVHARSRAPAWPGLAAARATHVPFITTYHGIYNANSFLKRRYNSVMTRGEHIIANSAFTKAHIIAEHGTDPEKITVIPRGVDMDVFDPVYISAVDRDAQRQIWGVPKDVPLIVLPGRLTRWKGQAVAIDALADIPDAYLVLLGDAQGRDSYVRSLHDLAQARGVSERLIIPGHSQTVALALATADVVLSTSTDPEAFGRVAAEAQAMARPVIASAHGGALETVMDGKTGFLVPPGDVGALSAAIKRVFNGFQYDGRAARQRIERDFSVTQLQKSTLTVYQSHLYA